MTDIPDGGPAFPSEMLINSTTKGSLPYSGMSLRDYFAAQALAGFCTTMGYVDEPNWWKMSRDAYDVADAMIEARKVQP
ncbi:MAG: hypothetical protein Tp118SUR00d2C21406231_33 [Prokaryotic dsDNA virus sp.]|nr:MAG: hypothetical protein Tp125DCM00d2C40298531_52 [Prokaryotic dsDNA virus sp.]QDP53153.1 MAG: hypothetical protein Tp118SUR00d2C21406231_33 [Prokaryotic dsDNA virus sp.]|tara:strand:- start:21682 stop:21918 length:237 start_codon:yes stop_codon:yes gene_type:complete